MLKILGLIFSLALCLSVSSTQSLGDPCTKDGELIESSFNCNHYYKCIDGKYQNQTCGSWSNFDYKKKECRWSLLANCRTVPDNMEGQSCSKNGDVIASATDCKNYYVCAKGKLVKNSCAFWKQFDIIMNECRWAFLSTCRKDNKDIKPCLKDGEIVASRSNCKEYYKCVNGEFIKQVCGIGQKFDIKMNDCIWSFDATCKNSTFNPVTDKTKSIINPKTKLSENRALSFQTSDVSKPSHLVCSPCKGDEPTGVYDNCQHYCNCKNGKPDGNPKKCLYETYYNTKLKECTSDNNVCKHTPSSLPQGSSCSFVGHKFAYPGDCYYYLECSTELMRYQLKSCGMLVFDKETKSCRHNFAVKSSFPFFYYRCNL